MTSTDNLVSQIKDALDARYQAGHEDGYRAALHELVGHIADKLGLRPEPATQEPEPDAPANGPPNLPNVQKYLLRAYERLKTAPGITSREARERWSGSSAVLYKLREAGLAEKRGAQFYAVER